MKISDLGREWAYDSSREESLVRDKQRQFMTSGKTIWGTEDCQRCGACCVYFSIPKIGKSAYSPCPNLETCGSQTSCRVQESKPETCTGFKCNKLKSDIVRTIIAGIAVQHLGTKSEIPL